MHWQETTWSNRSLYGMSYTRRPPTLSINELNNILTASLDIENVPESVLHVPLLLTPEKSTFHRLFSRSSPHLSIISRSPTTQLDEPVTPSPRKMTWRLPRLSPHKRSPRAESHPPGNPPRDASVPMHSPARSRSSSVTSIVPSPLGLTRMSSTSSLGSLIPPSERIFNHIAEENVYSETGNVASSMRDSHQSSPIAIVQPPLPPTQMTRFPTAPRSPLQALFRIKKSPAISVTECQDVNPDPEPIDDDTTPRATEFTISSHRDSGSTIQAQRRRRLSALTAVLSQETTSLCLEPAIGVPPHVPSDTEGSVSACSLRSPTTSIHTSSSHAPSTSHNALASTSTKSLTSTTSSFLSRARAGSRSMQTTPPLLGPPPNRPLPLPPTLVAQDPPAPTLLKAQVSLPAVSPSLLKPCRTPMVTVSSSDLAAISAPGSLRLPSRLSWGATGRSVVPLPSSLPSPPSSPSNEGRKKKLSGRSSTKDQKNDTLNGTCLMPGKRKSVGVLEAACDLEARVRRTKSILLLGTQRSRGALSGTDSAPKRVQILTAENPDTEGLPTRPRRKSSAACTNPFLALPRERRQSAPLLGSAVPSNDMAIPPVNSDWTLSLPFCIDTPGSGIILPTPPSEDGALHEAGEILQVQRDDWTLSLGADQIVTNPVEGVMNEGTDAKDGTKENISAAAQLPTPSPSPEPQDDISSTHDLTPLHSRPASPASLGPHCGGLDIDGGYGKRGSGWDACGWFGFSSMEELPNGDMRPVSMVASEALWVRQSTDSDPPRRSDVCFTRASHEKWMRHPSGDSVSTARTMETVFYSARTSVLVV